MEVHLMTEMISDVENTEDSKPETGLDDQRAQDRAPPGLSRSCHNHLRPGP